MATRSNPQNQTKQPLSNEDTTTRELDEKDLYISNLETEVLLLKAAVTKLKSELGGFRARSATKTLVEGDFRQSEILIKWKDLLLNLEKDWITIDIETKVGSGTYIRTIANEIGEYFKCGGIALDINRISIDDMDDNNINYILKK